MSENIMDGSKREPPRCCNDCGLTRVELKEQGAERPLLDRNTLCATCRKRTSGEREADKQQARANSDAIVKMLRERYGR